MSADLTAGAALRWARAVVLSYAVLTFASVAHVQAGGRLPGRFGMTVLTVLTTAFLASQLRRPASTARIVVLLAGGQAALHGVFTAVGGHPGAAGAMADDMGPMGVAVPHGGIADALGADQIAVGLSTGLSPVNAWVHHLVEDLSTPANQRMAAAHFAAAVLLGVWLASGERLVWRLVVLLAGPTAAALAHVRALLGGLAAAGRRVTSWTPPSVVPRWDDPPPPAPLRLACALVRRGPPAFSS